MLTLQEINMILYIHKQVCYIFQGCSSSFIKQTYVVVKFTTNATEVWVHLHCVFHLSKTGMKPWQPVFGWWRYNFRVFLFCFFFGIPVWLISVKDPTAGFWSVAWKKLAEPSVECEHAAGEAAQRGWQTEWETEKSQHDVHHYLPNLDTESY